MKILSFLLILLLTKALFAGDSISGHLSEIDGIEKSVDSAKEQIKELNGKRQKERSIERKQLIKKDINNLEQSINMFEGLKHKTIKHVMLEHNKKDRDEFKKNMANRVKVKQRAVHMK